MPKATGVMDKGNGVIPQGIGADAVGMLCVGLKSNFISVFDAYSA